MSKYKNKISGIYRSRLEVTAAELLKQNKIKFEYEPYELTLIEKFTFPINSYERVGKVFKKQSANIRKMTYIPDFIGTN